MNGYASCREAPCAASDGGFTISFVLRGLAEFIPLDPLRPVRFLPPGDGRIIDDLNWLIHIKWCRNTWGWRALWAQARHLISHILRCHSATWCKVPPAQKQMKTQWQRELKQGYNPPTRPKQRIKLKLKRRGNWTINTGNPWLSCPESLMGRGLQRCPPLRTYYYS